MQPFPCEVCDQLLFFDNSTCLRCRSVLGFVPDELKLVALTRTATGFERVGSAAEQYRQCGNLRVAKCNWLLRADDPELLCASCRLTSVRPSDTEVDAIEAFAAAETAKRRLLYQLMMLELPVIDRSIEAHGVAFEFLSSRGRQVITGHDAGVITLDLSESDDAHREFVRQQLGEPYRTVLGHLRHEIAHYYWPRLVVETGKLDAFRALFGDERISYEDALSGHYSSEPGADWAASHVSQYAAMHPWEDWAETFAHYLHIDSGLQTAMTFGLKVGDPAAAAGRVAWSGAQQYAVGPMVQSWLGLTLALNGMSRSIGQGDLYPFVLSRAVVEKLNFVHLMVTAPR